MPRPKLATSIRRDQIAEATLALVAEQGLGRLSVAQVAKRVGIAPSALYRHYPSKEAMFDAVLERVGGRLHGLVGAAAEGATDEVDAIHRLIGLHLELIRGNQAFFAIMVNDAFHSGAPERRQRVLAVITGYLARVTALVKRGQASGAIRPDVPARTLAAIYFGIVQPAAMLWVLSGGATDIHRPAREAWPLLEHTLRAHRPRRATPRAPRSRRTGDRT